MTRTVSGSGCPAASAAAVGTGDGGGAGAAVRVGRSGAGPRFAAHLTALVGDDTKQAAAHATRVYFVVRTREAGLSVEEVRRTAPDRAREMVGYRLFRDMMADNAPAPTAKSAARKGAMNYLTGPEPRKLDRLVGRRPLAGGQSGLRLAAGQCGAVHEVRPPEDRGCPAGRRLPEHSL
ncbi:hypothetical protein ACFWP7_30345 [Streptomyces sp. NPDC058470]|uniref:hypothetical protein n=1 Tax=Streptomyces sp. NPDC058470 TaxID=3346515 RepID=UPI0036585953